MGMTSHDMSVNKLALLAFQGSIRRPSASAISRSHHASEVCGAMGRRRRSRRSEQKADL